MKRKRFTEEQITYALRQAENGMPVAEVCRKLGVTEQSFYRWKRKYAGMGIESAVFNPCAGTPDYGDFVSVMKLNMAGLKTVCGQP